MFLVFYKMCVILFVCSELFRDEGSHNTSEKNTNEYKAQVEELNAKVKNLETEIKTTKEGQT